MPDGERYAAAGVSLERAERATRGMRDLVTRTFTPEVVGGFGGFGGGFDVSARTRGGETVLVASADGVGTKLEVAVRVGRHDSVGEDLVNHCVNDILVKGARPLFFLDYIGCGRLVPERITEIVSGFARGCLANGCALLGGETAEMPGLYEGERYDLAGFVVGAVERPRLLDGSAIRPGDVALGLPSSGLHTNGYSLARRIVFEDAGLGPDDELPGCGRSVADELLAVHRSYLAALEPLLEADLVHGMVHVTGGGFEGNVPRVLPADVDCEIDASAWDPPAVFRFLARQGRVPPREMYRVFNMGMGLLAFVGRDRVQHAIGLLREHGSEALPVGRALPGRGRARLLMAA
ncbi:MAG: phosphoribosylformylglycinamidine cyclo-ligase [Gemmatimonadetes bacterium]|nr:phosphoribosylformylglycinamidine cyclo-ligase [Gemmatimonadota bacterium]